MSDETPPMPTSQEEWATHWAFYRLTVTQRDQAWREVEELRSLLRQDFDKTSDHWQEFAQKWLDGTLTVEDAGS